MIRTAWRVLGVAGCVAVALVAPSTFPTRVRPLLEAKCMPCHFEGGKVYGRFPFDRRGTVRALGDRLFTRLKDPEDQAVIRAFLAEPPEKNGVPH